MGGGYCPVPIVVLQINGNSGSIKNRVRYILTFRATKPELYPPG